MAVNEKLGGFLLSRGATLAGYADLSHLPPEARSGYPRGIIIGVALNPRIIAGIQWGRHRDYYQEYQDANRHLNRLAEMAAEYLKEQGYGAYPRTQNNVKIREEDKTTELPHKTLATLAGIGWIGKCALLVTESWGSALRITAVLTDAPLDTGIPIVKSRCGNCSRCVEACPAQAATGGNWQIGMERQSFFDALACRDMIQKRGKEHNIPHGGCSFCIPACPWTQDYLKRHSILDI